MEYAIQTRGLTKDYGSFVLDSIDLTLPKGTILGLIGENGLRYKLKNLSSISLR